ncbi:unnamed protein product, partial [Candidula unifasciata]
SSQYNHGCHINSGSDYVRDLVKKWTTEFSLHDISEPDVSAEIIIAHVLGHKTLHRVDQHTTLTSSEVSQVNRLCRLRLARMPVQYIIGEWDFHALTLKMKSPVLIPRPETEELASLCVATLNQSEHLLNSHFLEIGVGTGAVSIYLLKMLKQLQGIALDISPHACQLTSENAENVGVLGRLQVIKGDFNNSIVFQQLKKLGPYSLIVSNPPYVPSDEMTNLQPEIIRYEDHGALDGGPEGMNLIRQIVLNAGDLLDKRGHMWLEVAPHHSLCIQNVLEESEHSRTLTLVETVKDVFGKNRFCHLQKC